MAHGTPDWGGKQLETVYFLSDDLAELAVRLGSIVSYDRRGRVIFMDDFNKGIASWVIGEYGTGADVSLTTSYPNWPPFCLKMTAGSTSIRGAQITQYVNPHPLKTVGLEVSAAFFSRFTYFTLSIDQYTGSYRYRAEIKLFDAADLLQVYAEPAGYKSLGALPDLVNLYGLYHQFKLVADFENTTYIRFLLNEEEYNLSAYTVVETADTSNPHVYVKFYLSGRSGQNDYCHVDGVIVTQNEE